MNYAVEQRLRMIDFLVHTYGHIGRGALIDYFGIGVACATRDFRTYKDLAPGNIIYDIGKRRYYKTQEFKRLYE